MLTVTIRVPRKAVTSKFKCKLEKYRELYETALRDNLAEYAHNGEVGIEVEPTDEPPDRTVEMSAPYGDELRVLARSIINTVSMHVGLLENDLEVLDRDFAKQFTEGV